MNKEGKKKGRAIIINTTVNRKGSDRDVSALEDLFAFLKFEQPRIYQNEIKKVYHHHHHHHHHQH